jgi:hypothetical protein
MVPYVVPMFNIWLENPVLVVEKTKYMLLSRHLNAGQDHDIKIANIVYENVSQFKYLGMTVTNKNLIQEEITRRLNSGNACYYSVQYLLSSCLLSLNIKIRLYKTRILSVAQYGCETWSLALRVEHRLRIFENRVPRKIFGPKRCKVTGEWRELHNEELRVSYSSPSIIRTMKSRRRKLTRHVARMAKKSPCEHCNELLGSVKCWETTECLHN